MFRAWVCAILLLTSCGGQGNGEKNHDAVDVTALESIRVEPADMDLQTGPAGAATVVYSAVGVFKDGSEAPLEVVSWEVSNKSAGTIDDNGVFRTATGNGGITWITATLDGVVGTADVQVRYIDVVEHPDVDPTIFDRPPVYLSQSSWLYPPDQVALPRNTPSILWQWNDPSTLMPYPPSAAEAYRISFTSDLTEIVWYVPAIELELSLDDITWATISSTNAGGEVAVTLEAALVDQVAVLEPLIVHVQRMDAQGSVIYWSVTEQGLKEIPYGQPAVDLLTVAQSGHCTGCHDVSVNGFLSFSWDGGNGSLGLRDLNTGMDILASGNGRVGNFQSFGPYGSYLVATDHGNLDLYDGMTGVHIDSVAANGNITHPSWAPDDSALVYTHTDGHDNDWTLSVPSRLARMDHQGYGRFGNERIIYQPEPGFRAYYPAWSPDSEWLAFNISTGDAYDDPDAKLWVMPADESTGPIPLILANAEGDLTNSWPRWAPLPDDEVLWLAFASRRNYGRVTTGVPQIWVTAFDPAKARDGLDPSSPAFWLPGQSTTSSNHIPLWTR